MVTRILVIQTLSRFGVNVQGVGFCLGWKGLEVGPGANRMRVWL